MSNQKPYLRGLPLHLADGQEYYFPSIRLGAMGEPIRKQLRAYSDLMLEIVSVARALSSDTNTDQALERIQQFNKKSDELSDQKDTAFMHLCATVLSENYGEETSRTISENLITPEVIPVILEIIRAGRYPESFTHPSSSQ